MIYSDFNVHLPRYSKSSSAMLEEELHLSGHNLLHNFDLVLSSLDAGIAAVNIMLFNQCLSPSDVQELLNRSISYSGIDIRFTLLASPHLVTSLESLDSFKSAGISDIKFHSYQQSINHNNCSPYIELAKWAQILRIPILIDASFGSLDMYTFDNLKLVSYIAAVVTKVPIVILHSGGARLIEALLLAESSSNLFLETSFTLPYFLGSSVEVDLAFAYKKLGAHRVVYASDHPYINSSFSLQTALDFCDNHGFSVEQKSYIFSYTFSSIFSLIS